MPENINAPAGALRLLHQLEQAGYQAYLVGGCVRDSLLGIEPKDWDIATDALPSQVQATLVKYPLRETGLKHGTVTVLLDHQPFEITTFRADGEYLDYRRPSGVHFIGSLRDDLARRDFTINAMAWNSTKGVVDHFHGKEDLLAGRITCVGNPEQRFCEDALRVLRAMRFASTLQFVVEGRTAAAMERCAPLLRHIAPERVRTEWNQILTGSGAKTTCLRHTAVLRAINGDFERMLSAQEGMAWMQAMCAMDDAPVDLAVRLALLFACCLEEQDAVQEAGRILTRMRYDNETRRRVEVLLRWQQHSVDPSPSAVKRWLNRLGEQNLIRLLWLWRSLSAAGGKGISAGMLQEMKDILASIRAQGACYRLSDLAVGGEELMKLGISEGKRIGETLAVLLEDVIDGTLPNERQALLRRAQEIMSEREER